MSLDPTPEWNLEIKDEETSSDLTRKKHDKDINNNNRNNAEDDLLSTLPTDSIVNKESTKNGKSLLSKSL